MKFLVAPNAMKGAVSAQKLAVIIIKTLRRRFPDAVCISMPAADGGNGTLDCLMNAFGGTVYELEVTGPIPSMRTTARYGITADGTGIIESAEAVGLHLLTPSPATIAHSTTRGIGELALAAAARGCTSLVIGLGGTATNDGGAGFLRALGYSLLDEHGEPLKEGSIPLLQLHSIHPAAAPAINRPVTILSDVRNLLLGPDGATAVFAPQKGAAEDQRAYLESALKNFAEIAARDLGARHAEQPGTGAAGGTAFGILCALQGSIVPGIEFILNSSRFDDALAECDAVITTEGMLDAQTLSGKGIAGIAERTRKAGKPLHAFVGRVNGDAAALQRSLGLASLTAVSPDELSTQQAMRDASWLLADALFHHPF
ncbi:MAG: glycerate kinase [Bacteroidetes bacterium]|nr:glycerate kinase [Bacteroidota bacterium]